MIRRSARVLLTAGAGVGLAIGPRRGQQLCVQINSTLQCIGQPPVTEPPAPVVFTPNPVGDLAVVNDEGGGVRLLLTVGPAVEDIMLFG